MKLKVPHRVYRSPLLQSIVKQFKPVHIFNTFSSQVHFNIILPSSPGSSKLFITFLQKYKSDYATHLIFHLIILNYYLQIFSWAQIGCICSWTAQTQCLLGLVTLFIYNAVQSVQTQPTFRSNTLPPSSGSKNKSIAACYLLHAALLLGLSFNSENSGDMFFQKVDWL
jgi:hypothetical protein